MPFFDRFWWLRLLGAVGLPILVAAMVVDLALTYPWQLLADPDFRGMEQWILGGEGLIMVMLLLQAVSLARSARPARDRHQR